MNGAVEAPGLDPTAARCLDAVVMYVEEHGYRSDDDMPLAASHCLARRVSRADVEPLFARGLLESLPVTEEDAACEDDRTWRLTQAGMALVRSRLGWQAYDAARTEAFDAWVRELDEDVVQGEYGYERGEFAVYPDAWRHMFEEGLSPAAAFRRALDAHALERDRREGRIIEGDPARVY